MDVCCKWHGSETEEKVELHSNAGLGQLGSKAAEHFVVTNVIFHPIVEKSTAHNEDQAGSNCNPHKLDKETPPGSKNETNPKGERRQRQQTEERKSKDNPVHKNTPRLLAPKPASELGHLFENTVSKVKPEGTD
eukprot:CAMPEP_0114539268 /NCGR_PEP_ID=MMETSP0114-20121206/147_1 /TAXON_ID=31324 /ORGANISM="Goniomonas sp, Strain m" /LENGTH=133 /DNA_ID=CAMNT_0001723359 /DNA_START=331 /DNA_END=732 /DNA_ORIENTATION=-